jgi:hypothetical protein
MALTEYSITYTRTNQTTAKSTQGKTVQMARSNFTASGNTNLHIGQITRILFKHKHSNGGYHGWWATTGRMYFGDGTSIKSDTIRYEYNGNQKWTTNTFSSGLPTPENFATWTRMDLIPSNHSGSGTLQWWASSSQPITITVYFYKYEDLIVDSDPPTISGVSIADSTGHSTTFGSPVQAESRLTITGEYALDPRYPDLSAVHTLTLTDSGGTDIYVASQSNNAVFNVGAIAGAGTITWTYTVTDGTGGSATDTGTFSVLPYAPPAISGFAVERYTTVLDDQGNPTYVASEDGDHVRFTFTATVTPVNEGNPWTLALNYVEEDGEGAGTTVQVASEAAGGTLTYTEDRTILTAAVSANVAWRFTIIATDAFGEVGSMSGYVDEATAFFNVEENGVSVGMRSTGTAAEKLFEVADGYEARLYGGIRGVTNFVTGVEIKTGGRWIDGRPIYQQIIKGTTSNTGTVSAGSLGASVGAVVRIAGQFLRASDNIWRTIPYILSSVNWAAVCTVSTAGAVSLYFGTNNSGSKDYYVVIEYTKATDDARTLWVYSDAGGDVVLAEQIAGSFTFTDDGAGNIVITAMPAGLALTDDGNGNLEIE